MKYYSEQLKKIFDSAAECEKAEADHKAALEEKERKQQELTAQRKERAAEVESAYKEMIDAQKKFYKLKGEFLKDYKSFHMTFSTQDTPFDNLFKEFFNFI